MTERWRDELGRLDGAEPDRERIRSKAELGPRMPDGDGGGTGRRVLAAVVALVVAAGSLVLVVNVFGDRDPDAVATPTGDTATTGLGPSGPTGAATTGPSATLDPAAICDVPAFDPNVALLVGTETLQVAKSALEEPGVPASSLDDLAGVALQARLAMPAAVNAPADGWRRVAESDTAVTFASPLGEGRWWIESFEDRAGVWRNTGEEIVEQRETPAQLGHDLGLQWNGELVLDVGAWNDPLSLVNRRTDAAEVGATWADVHLFDSNGAEVAPSGPALGFLRTNPTVAPGDSTPVPVALGAKVASLDSGTYSVVACIPGLGLASPVGTLRVVDPGAVPNVRVLAYEFTGAGMDALTFGTLAVVHGCLGLDHVGESKYATYILWPEGYALVQRDGRTVLINPVGEEVAALGDEVSLGGGGAPLRLIEDGVIGGIPDSCRTGGEAYFITSGAA
jgi:hypothetical protein